jgi:putative sigma-54 modulation protein
MNIQIQAINFVADKHLKDFINKKVDKLISIKDSVVNADIYLKIEKPESHDNKIVKLSFILPMVYFLQRSNQIHLKNLLI